jgi:hypothetical protein
MDVRRAGFDDLREILDFMEQHHQTSNLSDISFDRTDASKVADYYISSRKCHPILARNNAGKLIGILFGALEPFFFNSKAVYASDLQFISKGAGMQLLGEFRRWARAMGAKKIIMGVSSGDANADAFLELSGAKLVGGMYVLS